MCCQIDVCTGCQYFDIMTQMNVLAFRSLHNFTLICFDRDEKSHVTISLVTDRSDSINSGYRCFNKGARKLIETHLAAKSSRFSSPVWRE